MQHYNSVFHSTVKFVPWDKLDDAVSAKLPVAFDPDADRPVHAVVSAGKVTDPYKRRWAIELFFRWIKQTLKITRFLGVSENAVRTQIAAALIAFLVLRMAQKTQTAIASPLTFARLVKVNPMRSRSILGA